MSRGEPSKGSGSQGGLAAFGIAAFAVLCCAALPILAALAGSVAIGTVLGIGAGLAAAVLLAVAVVANVRRRRACAPPGSAPDPQERDAPRASSRESMR